VKRHDDSSGQDLARILRRNLGLGVLGVLARGLHLVVLLAVGHALGASTLGHFVLGAGLFEIAAAVVATGFTDGTLLLVSRAAARRAMAASPPAAGAAPGSADPEIAALPTAEVTEVVGTALGLGGLAATALAVLVTIVALVAMATEAVASHGTAGAPVSVAPAGDRWPAAVLLAWAVLPTLITRVAFAATSAFLRLEWEALLGTAGPPLGILLALPVVRATGGGTRGLFAAVLLVQTTLAGLALHILHRHLPAGAAVLRHPRWRHHRGLLAFALPQSLNMAATTYLARLDVLALSASGVPATVVGAYGTVAALVLELRQVRMVMSGALGSLVARQHALGARSSIARSLSDSAAWIASIAVPLALALVVFRRDLVALVVRGHPFGGEALASLLPVVLVAGPVVNCVGGLAGNFLIYLLHNRWNLLNAVVVAIVDTALCGLLVPRLGVLGAAVAGTLGLAAVTVLENVELARLERIAIEPRVLASAAATLAAGAVVISAIDPLAAQAGLAARAALALVVGLLAAGAAASRPRLQPGGPGLETARAPRPRERLS
jgi:Polysaccharide biosynthesis C-terminal domain